MDTLKDEQRIAYKHTCIHTHAQEFRRQSRGLMGEAVCRAGNATVSSIDRQQKQRESQTDRQRDVGGSRGGRVCLCLFVLLMFDENTAAFSHFR